MRTSILRAAANARLEHDPYFSSVVLGMHMDGADNGTTFTDITGKTVTRAGNTVTKTATKKYGTASAYFDGNGDYLSFSTSDIAGSMDFTLEAWVYATVGSVPRGVVSCLTGYTAGALSGVALYLNSDNTLIILTGSLFAGATYAYAVGGVTPLNQWVHVAGVRASGVLSVYINGVAPVTTRFGTDTSINRTAWEVGSNYVDTTGAAKNLITGYIDDVRITKNVARYTANFTPPTRPFPNGA